MSKKKRTFSHLWWSWNKVILFWHKHFGEITIINQRTERSPEQGLLHLFTGLNHKLKNKEFIICLILAAKLITVQYWKTLDNLITELQITKSPSIAKLEKMQS